MRRALAMIAISALAAGCGGGSDVGSPKREGDRKGAENAVRDYLRALVDKDGDRACSKFTRSYQRTVVEKNAEFARKQGVDTCGALIDSVTKTAGPATFEGRPLNSSTVEKIKLVTTVRVGGEEQNATVTGAQGLQRYELVTDGGRWLIDDVTDAGG
jgi:limonene-1,2-epoxide hydrolase